MQCGANKSSLVCISVRRVQVRAGAPERHVATLPTRNLLSVRVLEAAQIFESKTWAQ